MRRLLGAAVALGLLGGVVSYLGAPASATAGALPGGTGMSVRIDSPADGAEVAPGAVTVSGTATVDAGAASAHTAVIFVLGLNAADNGDAGPFAGACPGLNTILDCEKTYVSTLDGAAVDGGAVAAVGVAGYAESGLVADVGPAGGEQLITGPGTDADGAGGRDVVHVGFSAFANRPADTTAISGFDAYDPRVVLLRGIAVDGGIQSAVQLAQAAGQPNTIVAFLSDGAVPQPDAVAAALDQVPAGVHFWTYSIGANATCAGSLRLMADRTGGKCGTPKNRFGDGNHTVFGDDGLGDLPDLLRGLRTSRLTALALTVDGGPARPVDAPGLPARGPASVGYSTTLTDLAPGSHRICVTATGSDSGGTGTAADCHTVLVDAPPTGSLALTAAVSPAATTVGGAPLTVTYTLTNTSKTAMPAVRLTTRFPAGLAPTGGPCVPNSACDLGTLQAGQRRTVQFTIPATRAVDDKAVGAVTTTGPDSNPNDNSAAVRIQIR